MRVALLFAVGLLWAFAHTAQAQAVQRKHLLSAMGAGAGLTTMIGPVDSLRMAATTSGVVRLNFAYALGDRWSLGVLYDRIGSEDPAGAFDRMRVTTYLLQLSYRPWIGTRAALELHAAVGPSVIAITPSVERLPVTATPSVVNLGVRYLHLLGGTVGVFIGADQGGSSEAPARFKEKDLRDANDAWVPLSWSASRLTLGTVIRF